MRQDVWSRETMGHLVCLGINVGEAGGEGWRNEDGERWRQRRRDVEERHKHVHAEEAAEGGGCKACGVRRAGWGCV